MHISKTIKSIKKMLDAVEKELKELKAVKEVGAVLTTSKGGKENLTQLEKALSDVKEETAKLIEGYGKRRKENIAKIAKLKEQIEELSDQKKNKIPPPPPPPPLKQLRVEIEKTDDHLNKIEQQLENPKKPALPSELLKDIAEARGKLKKGLERVDETNKKHSDDLMSALQKALAERRKDIDETIETLSDNEDDEWK